MKKILVCMMLVFCWNWHLGAQQIAVKSNVLYDATSTINLGMEFGLGKKFSLDVSGNYNPWVLNKEKRSKIKHVMAQPEFRYWFCERFNGHFIGVHGIYAFYNVGGVKIPLLPAGLKDHRYQGWAAGAGIAYGYQWVIGKRWNLEATIGAGWMYTRYDKYQCVECGRFRGSNDFNYFGPTKAGLSFIYIIK